MTTIHQLNPPFHLWIPEAQDHGLALFLIDYHVEEHLYWVCALEKTGEIWTLSNEKVRADVNRSIGRVYEKSSLKTAISRRAEEAQKELDEYHARFNNPLSPPMRMRGPEVHLEVPSMPDDRDRAEQSIHLEREGETAYADSLAERTNRLAKEPGGVTEAISRVLSKAKWTRVPAGAGVTAEDTGRKRPGPKKGYRRVRSKGRR